MRENNLDVWQCPVCNDKHYIKIENSSSRCFKDILLISCKKCTAKSVFPMPSVHELIQFNKSYWELAQPLNKEVLELMFEQAKSRIKYIKRWVPNFENMKILDFGSGPGYIYDLLNSSCNQNNYIAVESDIVLQSAISKKGAIVFDNLHEVQECNFDIIILSHIVEHFGNPNNFLLEIKEKLKKDGFIFIEIPNQDDIYKFDLGAHLVVYNKKAIAQLLERVNFKIINLTTVGENINFLKPKKIEIIIRGIKYILKKSFPIIFKLKFLKTFDLSKIQIKNKKSLEAKFKLNYYTDNGRWLRILAQNHD